MEISREQRERAIAQVQGAVALEIAFIGLANGLLSQLDRLGQATAEQLSAAAGVDPGYVTRWCDAAYAFGYLSESQGRFQLTELGQAFRPDVAGTLMSFAVQSVLSAHMAERAAAFMKTGERPGEKVLEERATILPLFGAMLENGFGPIFEQQILSAIPAFAEVEARQGMAAVRRAPRQLPTAGNAFHPLPNRNAFCGNSPSRSSPRRQPEDVASSIDLQLTIQQHNVPP